MTHLFNERVLRERAAKSKAGHGLHKSAKVIIEDMRKSVDPQERFQVFLSHKSSDSDLVLGLRETFADMGFSVYIDWIEDAELNRTKVTSKNAAVLRSRMKQCASLVYAFSENAAESSWMPWELGYSDALHSRVAVLPIKTGDVASTAYYAGVEFVGIYPVVRRGNATDGRERLWVYAVDDAEAYVEFSAWLGGAGPARRS